jgi:hypothetical protein
MPGAPHTLPLPARFTEVLDKLSPNFMTLAFDSFKLNAHQQGKLGLHYRPSRRIL